MTKNRTKIEAALGKLISAIQKEWGKELGEPIAHEIYYMINKAHDLLQAAKNGKINQFLKGASISEFIGLLWIEKHQSVKPIIADCDSEVRNESL